MKYINEIYMYEIYKYIHIYINKYICKQIHIRVCVCMTSSPNIVFLVPLMIPSASPSPISLSIRGRRPVNQPFSHWVPQRWRAGVGGRGGEGGWEGRLQNPSSSALFTELPTMATCGVFLGNKTLLKQYEYTIIRQNSLKATAIESVPPCGSDTTGQRGDLTLPSTDIPR